jgi:hypothetical protein
VTRARAAIVEQSETDLVRVLVLHDSPRERPGVEQPRVEGDLARNGLVGGIRADVDRDRPRDDAPVERAGGERVPDLLLLRRGAAVEDVGAARGERRA